MHADRRESIDYLLENALAIDSAAQNGNGKMVDLGVRAIEI
jgi:hypothetical protein